MTLLEASGLTQRYGAFTALDGVDLSVRAGEFVSIIGPNGAGKTTLINVLTGLLVPTSGTVRFKGVNVAGAGPVRLARLGMARSFQLVSVFPALTVAEMIGVAALTRLGRGRRLFASHARDAEVRTVVSDVAHLFGLGAHLGRPARTLAQGDKKLLDVASAFALNPDVILMDEPTSGVSTRDKHAIMEVLVGAATRIGVKAILQVEHDMDIVFGYSQRIVVLHQGKVLADATPDVVRADERVIDTVIGRRSGAAR